MSDFIAFMNCAPGRATLDFNITPMQLRVLLYISSKCSELNLTWMCYESMAKELRIKIRMMRRHIAALVEHGYIQTIGCQNDNSDLQTSNFIRIFWDKNASLKPPTQEEQKEAFERANADYKLRAGAKAQPRSFRPITRKKGMAHNVDNSVDNSSFIPGTPSTGGGGTPSTGNNIICNSNKKLKKTTAKKAEEEKSSFLKDVKSEEEKNEKPVQTETTLRLILQNDDINEEAKAAAPGWCMDWIMGLFIESWNKTGRPHFDNPGRAFVGYCRRHFAKNGKPK